MIVNQAARNLIVIYEGVRLTPYDDGAGNVTWGIGHKKQPGEQVPVSITQEQCNDLFQKDLDHASALVEQYITAQLTDNQFGALVSLAFNCGAAPLKNGLGQVLNRGDYAGCAQHFLLWDKETVNGDLQVSDGLAERRKAEMDLFLTPI